MEIKQLQVPGKNLHFSSVGLLNHALEETKNLSIDIQCPWKNILQLNSPLRIVLNTTLNLKECSITVLTLVTVGPRPIIEDIIACVTF